MSEAQAPPTSPDDVDVEKNASPEPAGGKKPRCSRRTKICCCCCCLWCPLILWIIGFMVLAVIGAGELTTHKDGWGQPLYDEAGRMVTPHNVTVYEWWPGCDRGMKDAAAFDACGGDCFTSELPMAMQTFNVAHDFTLVSFPSRAAAGIDTVQLTGWWLPAASPAAPIVIWFHGWSSSSNTMRAQLPAFFLRTLGFAVLLPNMRDHGSSGASSHGKVAWGGEYPYDVLGAWDFAVSDPDGVLGGAREAGKVGVAGGSLGGFSTATAFGMEGRIPGLWLDAAVYDPKLDLFGQALNPIGFLKHLFMEPCWPVIQAISGLDFSDRVPVTTWGDGPAVNRPIAVVQSPDDSAVPMTAFDSFVALANDLAGQYELKEQWSPSGLCNGDIHVLMTMKYPEEYRLKLCTFWSRALLGQECQASQIPTFSSIAGSSSR